MIYLDNGATTLKKPAVVIEAVTDALTHLGNAGRGATEESLETSRVIFQCRYNLAQLINAESPNQIAFTLNATESLNAAIYGLFEPGDHVITSVMEHNSVLRPLQELMDLGLEVTYLEVNDKACVRPEDVRDAIQPQTKGVILTHASNLTGNMNPIDEIAEITQENGLTFIVDASQSIGEHPIDVQKSGIDVLCFTGHKGLMGPQGTGGIYVRQGIEIKPLKVGGTGTQTFDAHHPRQMPTVLEAGTLNGHGIAGLNAAVEYILEEGVENIAALLTDLTYYFYDRVKAIPGVRVYGHFDRNVPRTPIISINIGNLDSSEVANILSEDYNIAVRAGGHCAPKMHQSLGTENQGVVRFSLSIFNNKEELDAAVQAVKEISEKYL